MSVSGKTHSAYSRDTKTSQVGDPESDSWTPSGFTPPPAAPVLDQLKTGSMEEATLPLLLLVAITQQALCLTLKLPL